MIKIVGILIILFSVFGGFIFSHGQVLSLWQPYELLIIAGAAFGAFLLANPFKLVLKVFSAVPSIFFRRGYTGFMYLELLALLYELFNKIRREGLIAVERDIEDPQASEIFLNYPTVSSDPKVVEFICDYLRMMVVGDMTAYELENLMDVELETNFYESTMPSDALHKVADALPGFGIVAAVLGIVITMGSLGGPPEELGNHVASALVGTFLGIFLAYGFVAPMALALEHQAREETKYYEVIKTAIIATVNGVPPQVAVEFGRKIIAPSHRPNFYDLEKRVRVT